MEKLERRYVRSDATATPLDIVDSYHMPHSFVIFRSTVLPQLVKIRKHKVHSEDYLPMVYEALDLE